MIYLLNDPTLVMQASRSRILKMDIAPTEICRFKIIRKARGRAIFFFFTLLFNDD